PAAVGVGTHPRPNTATSLGRYTDALMPTTQGASSTPATVGVVTPTLNAERYLERTLRSIWSQQGDGLRVRHVIVDGFSTDGTVEIAKRFPSEVVVAKDGGMYEAVNRGMAAVRGDIIGYINAD